jgi:hypothetical protein
LAALVKLIRLSLRKAEYVFVLGAVGNPGYARDDKVSGLLLALAATLGMAAIGPGEIAGA